MSDHALTWADLLLLVIIVLQGFFIMYWEWGVHKMNRERFEERAKWRREKQEQTRKKNTPKTSGSNANTESLLPDKTNFVSSKTTDAKSAE